MYYFIILSFLIINYNKGPDNIFILGFIWEFLTRLCVISKFINKEIPGKPRVYQ